MPEDERLSSGNSIIWGKLGKINNDVNVNRYKYQLQNGTENTKTEFCLTDTEYHFWEELSYLEADEYPQGLCFTEEYVMVSAYSGNRSKLGKIKIFDKQSGKYLLTLGLNENSHMGGIAYD